jgi:hypothetical protein
LEWSLIEPFDEVAIMGSAGAGGLHTFGVTQTPEQDSCDGRAKWPAGGGKRTDSSSRGYNARRFLKIRHGAPTFEIGAGQ